MVIKSGNSSLELEYHFLLLDMQLKNINVLKQLDTLLQYKYLTFSS